MMKTLTEYDYEPGEPVDYVTLMIYYQSLSQIIILLNFFIILQYYIVAVHIQVFILYSQFMPLQLFKVKQ